MTIYRIRYGMVGDYSEWEEIEARSYEEAMDYAMEYASEAYYNSPEPENIGSWITYEAEKV